MQVRQFAATGSGRILRRIGLYNHVRAIIDFLKPPSYPGTRLTPQRLLNLYVVRWQRNRIRTQLSGYPLVLTIEPTNVCNLKCPYCFTGAREVGRDRSMLDMQMYRGVLDELGGRLFQIELYNWGEPLLNKNIYEMIHMAHARGISTIISSNLSVPFDEERARKLVASGLDMLGVSFDGVKQDVYEQYRVGGNVELILKNIDLINDAKRQLGSKTPQMVWEYHLFPHNLEEVETARAMAHERDMFFAPSKGWVYGPDWDPEGTFNGAGYPGRPGPCSFLWERAVIQNDGGVAPCCATFYREDDYGAIRGEPSIKLSELEGRTFRHVWNNEHFVKSREMFVSRDRAGGRELVCYDCPITVVWDRWKKHAASGGAAGTFPQQYAFNDGFNYFFDRKPGRAQQRPIVDELIPLVELDKQPAPR